MDPQAEKTASSGSVGRARILVVDDEENIVQLVRSILERQGYAVDTASDGVEALSAIFDRRPDLVVLDVMMPRMDGLTLVEHLRHDPALSDLPVLLLTAKSQDSDILDGYGAGADIYLTKPFRPEELVEFVRRLLTPVV